MKALETKYREITFRSRTEARWAVFLDEIRVPYAYEPEGFDLGGDWYLPDFWLPSPGIWLEVKGVEPDQREERVAQLLSKASRCPVLIAVGQPSVSEEYNLRCYRDGEYQGQLAFAGTRDDLFLTDEWQSLVITVRGSLGNLSGIPDPMTREARLAAAQRFGVHESR